MGWKKWNGTAAIARMKDANEKALEKTAAMIGEKADQQIPIDEGTLKNSRFMKIEGTSAIISYGGGAGTGHPKVPYAVRWHEESANFQRGRKNRYLADPVNQDGPRLFIKALKQEIKRAL